MTASSSSIRTNKLNIYLIKEKYTSEDSITKISDDDAIARVSLQGIGVFYYKKSSTSPPEWLASFFNNQLPIDSTNFIVSGSKAVLIIKILYARKSRFFAIPFGSGRYLLRDYCYEERFGLITSLNILEAKSIRGLDKRTLSTNPKNSREQIARASEAVDFQIDFENDLIQSITGRSTDAAFGNVVTGKEALSISAKIDVTNISEFLKYSLSTYAKKDYQKSFAWIDQIKEVKAQITIEKLNKKLIHKINKKDDTVLLAVPEIIDWSDVKGFKYSKRKTDLLHDELDLLELLLETGLKVTTVDNLQDSFISCWTASDDEQKYIWSVFACLNAEIDIGKKKYILSNSKWYEINSGFVEAVNREYDEIQQVDLNMPDYDHANEGEYNVAAAAHLKAHCLDAQNIPYGGGYSKIEFCDILTKDKQLIHVKKNGGSAVLSHLFAQGSVSAQLLLSDAAFRQKVIDDYLPVGYKKIIPSGRPKASDYGIYYAIITKEVKARMTIPFFSKVVLKNNKRILEAYGFTVYLANIRNIKK